MRIVFLAATLLGIASAAWGSAPDPLASFNVSATPALGDPLPDRTLAYPGGIKALADVPFSAPSGFRPLTLDLYLPGGSEARPLLIYIHGGGWSGGHTRQAGAIADFPALLAGIARRGFVVASIEYRLSGEAPFPAALEDVRAAIGFLRTNVGRYRIDPTRVGVWGGSAGGQLAELAALGCNTPALSPPARANAADACVQAGVACYGVSDFRPLLARRPGPNAGAPAENAYLGCIPSECPAYLVDAASPIAQADASDPPLLLIHGTADKVVPVAQSQSLNDRLEAAGAPVELILIPGVDHSFIGATPEATAAATRQAVGATVAFFNERSSRPAAKARQARGTQVMKTNLGWTVAIGALLLSSAATLPASMIPITGDP